jgi:hypothetical protein
MHAPWTMVDIHGAFVALAEELETVGRSSDTIPASDDRTRRQELPLDRDEMVRYALVVLERVRRRDPVLAERLRRHLCDGDQT